MKRNRITFTYTGFITLERLKTSRLGNSRFTLLVNGEKVGDTRPNSDLAGIAENLDGEHGKVLVYRTPTGRHVVCNIESLNIDYMDLFAHLPGCDGTKWGASDWYDDYAALLAHVLPQRMHFDTQWAACRKEIVSTRITTDSDNPATLHVSVSVSDDFDTEAVGTVICCRPDTVEDLNKNIDRAWDKATGEQKSIAVYVGFSVLKTPALGKHACMDYIILPSDGDDEFPPPGDNYSYWGWQDPDLKIPKHVKDKLLAWAFAWVEGERKAKCLKLRGWTIKPWDAE